MPTRDSQPGRTASRPVVERLRALCLKLPETSERASWGHPNFRAGTKTFAAFEVIGGRPSIAFRLPPGEVEELLRDGNFFATPYGRGLWVSIWVDGTMDWKLIDGLLRRSYQTVALKRMLAAIRVPASRRNEK
jgi:predicted DNA-binding protein (MmcQ/YjbR family)